MYILLDNWVEEIVFSYIVQFLILDNFLCNLHVNLCSSEHLGKLFMLIHMLHVYVNIGNNPYSLSYYF